jgi:hypothetical protein
MREIRVAVEAESTSEIISGLNKVIEKLKEGYGSVPIYHNNGKYKIRFVVIDAENSSSFNDNFSERRLNI